MAVLAVPVRVAFPGAAEFDHPEVRVNLCHRRGTELPQSKLNETLVRRIREEHAKKERLKKLLDEEHSAAAIAKRYGVSVNTITKVLTYATWRHVLEGK